MSPELPTGLAVQVCAGAPELLSPGSPINYQLDKETYLGTQKLPEQFSYSFTLHC